MTAEGSAIAAPDQKTYRVEVDSPNGPGVSDASFCPADVLRCTATGYSGTPGFDPPDTIRPENEGKEHSITAEPLNAVAAPSHHNGKVDLAQAKAVRQLLEFFPNQELVWIWGHEHRLAIYDKYKMSGGITAYGRRLGHGGMPVELTPPVHQEVPLLYYDQRPHKLLDGTQVGVNGFVNLSLSESVLMLDYRDIYNNSLLVEDFKHAGGGRVEHDFVKLAQPGLTPGNAGR